MSSKTTCPIGECNITTINKFIECPFCKFNACLKCYKYFILQTSTNPSCMNCKKPWNDDFVDTIYPKSFRKKDLKTHNENLMFEKEQAMFAETCEIISRNKIKEKYKEEIEIYKTKIHQLESQIRILDNHSEKIRPEKNKVIIIKNCPQIDCRGYLNDKNICTICDTVVCSKCEIIKINKDHECNNHDIETVKLKKSTSKHCPRCSKITFKVDGCSQVWCPPPCNGGLGTAWNFNNGEIDNGRVHSPDYYEYMRKNNNGIVPPPQNICQRRDYIPDIWNLKSKMNSENFEILLQIHRFFTDFKYNIMLKFFINQRINDFDKNVDLRIKYLNKEITKEQFKKTLFARNKRDNKYNAIYQCLDMLYNVGKDIFNNLLYNHNIDPKTKLIDVENTFKELQNIRCYYNSTMKNIKERYDCKSLSVSKIIDCEIKERNQFGGYKWKFNY